MKYGKSERPVEVSLRRVEGKRIELTVLDYGIGIDIADHARIFDHFERAIPGTKISGFGLGLYISREIILCHGGSIRVESEPGKGAKFVVELKDREVSDG